MLSQKATLLLCLLLSCLATNAQELFPVSMGQLAATSGAATDDLSGWFDNPAATGRMEHPGMHLFGASPFVAPGWGSSSLIAGLPSGKNVLVLAAHTRGASYFNETSVRLGSARALNERLRLGLHVGLRAQRADNYEPEYLLEAGMGLQVRLFGSWRAGAAVMGLPGFVLDRYPAPALHFGLTGAVEEGLQLNFSIAQSEVFGLDWRAGLAWQVQPALVLTAGLRHAGIAQPSLGLGWQLHRKWSLWLATQYHPRLGWTPGIELRFGQR